MPAALQGKKGPKERRGQGRISVLHMGTFTCWKPGRGAGKAGNTREEERESRWLFLMLGGLGWWTRVLFGKGADHATGSDCFPRVALLCWGRGKTRDKLWHFLWHKSRLGVGACSLLRGGRWKEYGLECTELQLPEKKINPKTVWVPFSIRIEIESNTRAKCIQTSIINMDHSSLICLLSRFAS